MTPTDRNMPEKVGHFFELRSRLGRGVQRHSSVSHNSADDASDEDGMKSTLEKIHARFGAPTNSRILLIEDDRNLSDALSQMFEMTGFTSYATDLAEDALNLVRAYQFDLILLDLSLPDMSGLLLLQSLRKMRPGTPIILLSDDADIDMKINGFLEGADDYIVKPFHQDELLVRTHAILRRIRSATPSELTIGPLTIDFSAHHALCNGQRIPLTSKEYACLEFLASRRGTTVTKEMFLAHLYAGRDEPEMKIIDVFICKLRRKLLEAGAPPIIKTIWGRGYTIPADTDEI